MRFPWYALATWRHPDNWPVWVWVVIIVGEGLAALLLNKFI